MSYRICSHSSPLGGAPSQCVDRWNTQPVSLGSALPQTGKCSHREGGWLVALSWRPSLPRDHKNSDCGSAYTVDSGYYAHALITVSGKEACA